MERLVRYAPWRPSTPWIVVDPYVGAVLAARQLKAAAIHEARTQVSKAGGGVVLVFNKSNVLEWNLQVNEVPTRPVCDLADARSRETRTPVLSFARLRRSRVV